VLEKNTLAYAKVMKVPIEIRLSSFLCRNRSL